MSKNFRGYEIIAEKKFYCSALRPGGFLLGTAISSFSLGLSQGPVPRSITSLLASLGLTIQFWSELASEPDPIRRI